MNSPLARGLVLSVLALGVAVAAAGGDAMPAAPASDNVQKSVCRIWAKRFDPFQLEWRADAGARSIRCVTHVTDDGRGRKGARVTLTAEVTGAAGEAVSLGTRSARTDRTGGAVIEFPVIGVSPDDGFTARVTGRYSSWKKATTMATDCGPAAP